MTYNKFNCLLYTVVIFIIVSLTVTYNITNKLFGKLVGQPDLFSYGTGQSIKNRGFVLHIIVFALLVGAPMFLSKE